MTPGTDDFPIEPSERQNLPPAGNTLSLYLSGVGIGTVAGPVLGILTMGIHTIIDQYPHVSGEGMMTLLGLGLLLLIVFPLWSIISALFCAVIWLPLWTTRSRHPLFHHPLLSAITGALLGLVALGGILLLGAATASPAAPARIAGIFPAPIFLIGAIGGFAGAGGLVFHLSTHFHDRRRR